MRMEAAVAAPMRTGLWSRSVAALLRAVEVTAGALLAADLAVVMYTVLARYLFSAAPVWSDDVARMLLLAISFLGAAAALARGENAGVVFFVERLSLRAQRRAAAAVAVAVLLVAVSLVWNGVALLRDTAGQTVGSGLPQELFFLPLCLAAAAMAVFALNGLCAHATKDVAAAVLGFALLAGGWWVWAALVPEPNVQLCMAVVFVLGLVAGVPIAFVLALSALVFIWTGDVLPGEFFAQQVARGIDNFVLLSIPFFILVGYLMEANGMSVRLIALLQRLVGRLRGGLDVVMVLSMVVFSGISGSKMADVAAVGSVLVPTARRSGQKPGDAVALLAASAVMAETIPPCVNLIILGFVANISIGGLFMAGLAPAALMAAALIAMVIVLGRTGTAASAIVMPAGGGMVTSGVAAVGLIVLIFGGYRSGFATATEISAFANVYALLIGAVAFRETSWRNVGAVMRQAAARSGMILFIVATAQALAYVLTLQQIPHAIAEVMVAISSAHGAWLFMLLSIAILVVMGSVLEGAAALIIFGPLLMPVARQLGIDPLHYGIVLVIAMGVGLFAPPLGLGLYASCLVGGVRLEETVVPILKYLGLLLVCLVLIALVPGISTYLPRHMGY